MLFSGPKVLIDLPKSELEKLQEQEIKRAVEEHRVSLSEGKDLGQIMQIEAL